tara:strand:- start:475 stop:1203 length:729 start_codon:yes stop_codon:yes gene_type:complete
MSKTNIPDTLKVFINELKMTRDETVWDCHGTLVMYHKALEKIAAYKNVKFDDPNIIHQDVNQKSVVILVTGKMDNKSEWSFGEATPANNKNAYPFAMAEKRAKDRVILKLVGLHGDVYSDAEIDADLQKELENKAKRNLGKDPQPPKDEPPQKEIIKEDSIKEAPIHDPIEEETDPNKIADWEKIAIGYMKNIDQLPNQSVCMAWFNRNKTVLTSMKAAVPRLFGEIREHFDRKLAEIKNQN